MEDSIGTKQHFCADLRRLDDMPGVIEDNRLERIYPWTRTRPSNVPFNQ